MPGIFEYRVAYVESLAAFEPLRSVARLAEVVGLAVKLHDAGGNPVAAQNYDYIKAHNSSLRGQGFSLGAWSCPRTEPEGSAAAVSTIVGQLGLSFTVFETEWEYKTDGGGIDVKRLLTPWRSVRPLMYTGVAVEGGPPTTFNHAAAIKANTRLLPETYYQPPYNYDARAAFRRALSLGWNAKRIHPAASGVENADLCNSLIRLYRARSAGYTRGYMIWRGDMLSAAQYEQLGLADDLAAK